MQHHAARIDREFVTDRGDDRVQRRDRVRCGGVGDEFTCGGEQYPGFARQRGKTLRRGPAGTLV